MKRYGNLFHKIITDENLSIAIDDVNRSHRWLPGHKPNMTTVRVEATKSERIAELRQIILDGFIPSKPRQRTIYDVAAAKWRDICEPRLYPDQYVHHAIIQVLSPILMSRMDKWCCGSIRGRGTHYGANAIKKWMVEDVKGTKYCAELDIRKFYDSVKPEYVMSRLGKIVKDRLVLDLVERITAGGILAGYYFSQWFANMLLQPLDRAIRESGLCNHYVRYMDNFTLFGSNKRSLKKLIKMISDWLSGIELTVKGNWQIFKTSVRLPNALGYRYGRGYTLVRKATLLRIKRKTMAVYRSISNHAVIVFKRASGILARLGQLKHCNSAGIRKRIFRQNFIRMMKNIVRKHQRMEGLKWTTVLENYMVRRSFVEGKA